MRTIYEQFIDFCKSIENEETNSKIYMEKHHILPRHCGGSNNKSNLVMLSRKNHILAHYYRWISHNSSKDKIAYLFMVGDPDGEAKRESGRLAQKTWTPKKRSECSKKAYQTMLKRRSGITARGESWRKNVSNAAKQNIASNRRKRVSLQTLSLYRSKFELKQGSKVFILDQSQFSDFVESSKYVCNFFNIEIKESEHKKFLLLIKGTRKSFHGVTLNKAISSQAVEGQGSTEGSTTRQ